MILATPPVYFDTVPAGGEYWRSGNGGYLTSFPVRVNASFDGWAAAMPHNGIVVTVSFLGAPPGRRRLALELPARPTGFLEGTKDTVEYRMTGRAAGRLTLVRVDIRNAYPSAALRALAQRILWGLRIGWE